MYYKLLPLFDFYSVIHVKCLWVCDCLLQDEGEIPETTEASI